MKSLLLLALLFISSVRDAQASKPERTTHTIDTALPSNEWPVPKECLKYIPDVVYLLPQSPGSGPIGASGHEDRKHSGVGTKFRIFYIFHEKQF